MAEPGILRYATLSDRDGLHARNSTRIARTAARFACAVTVTWNLRTADAKSVLELLRLEAPGGARLELRAVGEDAVACLDAVGVEVARAEA